MVEQVLMSITHFSVHVKVLGCYKEVLKLAHRNSQGYEFQQKHKPEFPWGILSSDGSYFDQNINTEESQEER